MKKLFLMLAACVAFAACGGEEKKLSETEIQLNDIYNAIATYNETMDAADAYTASEMCRAFNDITMDTMDESKEKAEQRLNEKLRWAEQNRDKALVVYEYSREVGATIDFKGVKLYDGK